MRSSNLRHLTDGELLRTPITSLMFSLDYVEELSKRGYLPDFNLETYPLTTREVEYRWGTVEGKLPMHPKHMTDIEFWLFLGNTPNFIKLYRSELTARPFLWELPYFFYYKTVRDILR